MYVVEIKAPQTRKKIYTPVFSARGDGRYCKVAPPSSLRYILHNRQNLRPEFV